MYHCGIFTLATTGNLTILGLPFTPTRGRFAVNKSSNSPFHSAGEATSSTMQQANTTHFDVVPNGETLSDTTRCIIHRERQAGTLVTVLSARLVSFGINRFKVNVDVANASQQIFGEFWS